MVGLVTTLRECAETAAAALAEKLRASKGKIDAKAIHFKEAIVEHMVIPEEMIPKEEE